MSKAKFLLPVAILLSAALACNYVAPTPQSTSTPLPPTVIPELTVIVEPTSASTPNNLPLSEAQVERVPPDVAWTAMQSGAAVIVDVRSVEAYTENHIKGAISIPLAEIENNPTGLELDKEQWIITYCT
jgi:hypothetical protein